VEFEFSEYTALESAGLLEVTLLLLGREQLVSFNVTVIAYNTESSSSAIGNGLIGIIYVIRILLVIIVSEIYYACKVEYPHNLQLISKKLRMHK